MSDKSLARKVPRETFEVWHLIKETYHDWSKDQAATLGAAVAYYAIFSLGSLLVIIVAITGFFLGQETTRRTIMNQVQQSTGPAASSQASSSFWINRQVRPSLWAGITPFLAWRRNTSEEIWRKSAAAVRLSISSFIFTFAPDAIKKLIKFLAEKSCHQRRQ